MAVPDTTTFQETDVFTELGLPINGTNGLVQCFAAADPAQFDPAYEGSKNSLLNFRNYGGVVPFLDIVPTEIQVGVLGFNFQITITSNISWTVTDNAPWISVSPSAGSGNGSVTVTYTTNPGASREGTITVSGPGVASKFCEVVQQGSGNPTTPVQLGRSSTDPSIACTIGTVQYYLPAGQTWGNATTIYQDAGGTTLAPGGYWYSNQSTYRRWENGVLGGQIGC